MTERRPAEVFPAGEFLRDELEARGWTGADLAALIGQPVGVVNEVIAGERGISIELAGALAAALGTTPEFWMRLELAR